MPFVSLTRLRIRSVRFLPRFAWYTFHSLRQVKKAPGFRTGTLLTDRKWTFWTMTIWDSQEAMRKFMTSDAHKKAMPHLLNWCDEASVAHWEQEEDSLASWTSADQRMRDSGRASKVHNPSPQHATPGLRQAAHHRVQSDPALLKQMKSQPTLYGVTLPASR